MSYEKILRCLECGAKGNDGIANLRHKKTCSMWLSQFNSKLANNSNKK